VLVLKASAPESIGTSDWEQTLVAIPSNTISAPKTLFICNPFLRQFKTVDPRENRNLLAGAQYDRKSTDDCQTKFSCETGCHRKVNSKSPCCCGNYRTIHRDAA
jgi:hypothetical protein